MSRKQIIDIGSNSIKFLITEGKEIINKGKTDIGFYNMINSHSSNKHIISHIIVIIEDIIKNNKIYSPEETIIYATETMRQFEDRDICAQQIKSKTGSEMRILSPEEEAIFSYKIVAQNYPDIDNLIVIDMGGASTEVSLGIKGEYQQGVSLQVGTSNTSKIGLSKLESKNQLKNIIDHVAYLSQKPTLVLTGGTIDSLHRLNVVNLNDENYEFIQLFKVKDLFLERKDLLQEYRQNTTSNALAILEYVLDDILAISVIDNTIYLCKEDLRFYFI